MDRKSNHASVWLEAGPRYLIRDRDGAMAKSLFEEFDPWGFAIDRRRRAPHGKTAMLNDLSVRSDGSALTMLLCSASGIFVTCCCLI